MLEKIISQVVIVTIALGSIACLCPTAQAGEAALPAEAHHLRHHSSAESPHHSTGYEHAGSEARCSVVSPHSVESPATLSCKGDAQSDDDVLDAPSIEHAAVPRLVILTSFPASPPGLSRPTPVRRFDLLLE